MKRFTKPKGNRPGSDLELRRREEVSRWMRALEANHLAAAAAEERLAQLRLRLSCIRGAAESLAFGAEGAASRCEDYANPFPVAQADQPATPATHIVGSSGESAFPVPCGMDLRWSAKSLSALREVVEQVLPLGGVLATSDRKPFLTSASDGWETESSPPVTLRHMIPPLLEGKLYRPEGKQAKPVSNAKLLESLEAGEADWSSIGQMNHRRSTWNAFDCCLRYDQQSRYQCQTMDTDWTDSQLRSLIETVSGVTQEFREADEASRRRRKQGTKDAGPFERKGLSLPPLWSVTAARLNQSHPGRLYLPFECFSMYQRKGNPLLLASYLSEPLRRWMLALPWLRLVADWNLLSTLVSERTLCALRAGLALGHFSGPQLKEMIPKHLHGLRRPGCYTAPWTARDSAALELYVRYYDGERMAVAIALGFNLDVDKGCRRESVFTTRFRDSLHGVLSECTNGRRQELPTTSRASDAETERAWTPHLDALLKTLKVKHGQNWARIAEGLAIQGGLTAIGFGPSQCRLRWSQIRSAVSHVTLKLRSLGVETNPNPEPSLLAHSPYPLQTKCEEGVSSLPLQKPSLERDWEAWVQQKGRECLTTWIRSSAGKPVSTPYSLRLAPLESSGESVLRHLLSANTNFFLKTPRSDTQQKRVELESGREYQPLPDHSRGLVNYLWSPRATEESAGTPIAIAALSASCEVADALGTLLRAMEGDGTRTTSQQVVPVATGGGNGGASVLDRYESLQVYCCQTYDPRALAAVQLSVASLFGPTLDALVKQVAMDIDDM